ncbi:MAG: PIG-L family deacetylase [Microthrixaceae bacterium]
MSTVAFFHAHPDDEAIFTGGTMLRLKMLGHRVVLILATGGELGIGPAGPGELLALRLAEVERSARILGVDSVIPLGYHDSGMLGDPANDLSGSFWSADIASAAESLASSLSSESVDSLVVYDPNGIYGHPDHVKCHRVGVHAAQLADISSTYEMTVDREYLHFVETHLVTEAALGGDLGLAGSRVGYSTAEIELQVDVRTVIDAKRAAMACHTSQLPEDAPVFLLEPERFIEVYGWEWYVRTGTPGALETLR